MKTGESVLLSTSGASSESLSCVSVGTSAYKSVWYKVIGTGTTMTATTCFAATAFNAIVQVVEAGCALRACVGSSKSYSCGKYSWNALAGVEYHIQVFGSLSRDHGTLKFAIE